MLYFKLSRLRVLTAAICRQLVPRPCHLCQFIQPWMAKTSGNPGLALRYPKTSVAHISPDLRDISLRREANVGNLQNEHKVFNKGNLPPVPVLSEKYRSQFAAKVVGNVGDPGALARPSRNVQILEVPSQGTKSRRLRLEPSIDEGQEACRQIPEEKGLGGRISNILPSYDENDTSSEEISDEWPSSSKDEGRDSTGEVRTLTREEPVTEFWLPDYLVNQPNIYLIEDLSGGDLLKAPHPKELLWPLYPGQGASKRARPYLVFANSPSEKQVFLYLVASNSGDGIDGGKRVYSNTEKDHCFCIDRIDQVEPRALGTQDALELLREGSFVPMIDPIILDYDSPLLDRYRKAGICGRLWEERFWSLIPSPESLHVMQQGWVWPVVIDRDLIELYKTWCRLREQGRS